MISIRLRNSLAAVSFTVAFVHSANATVWYVDAAASPGGNGTTFTLAFNSIHPAIAVAQQSDEIRIAQGTYKATTEATMNGEQVSYTLVNDQHEGLRILGGYAGVANPANPNLRDINAYPTILDGFLGFDPVGGAERNTRHMFKIIGLLNEGDADQVFIEGLSIINAKADSTDDSQQDSWGGGALILDSSVASNEPHNPIAL